MDFERGGDFKNKLKLKCNDIELRKCECCFILSDYYRVEKHLKI